MNDEIKRSAEKNINEQPRSGVAEKNTGAKARLPDPEKSESADGSPEKPKWKAERLFSHKLSFLLSSKLYRLAGRIHANPMKTAEWVGIKKGMDILELGSGPGYYTPTIAKIVAPGKVVAVDLQQEMLDIVKKKTIDKGIANVELIKANAQNLPFEESSFDLIWALYVLEEVADLERVARELFRVLKKGATMAIAQVKFDFTPQQKAVMKKVMPAVGFEVLEEKDGWTFEAKYRKP